MNNIQRINVTTPQNTFTAKKPNRKAIKEFIDKSNILTTNLIKTVEHNENFINKAVNNRMIDADHAGALLTKLQK